jgi:hypothetical protein
MHTTSAPTIVTPGPRYCKSPTVNPPPASMPATIPTPLAPCATRDVFPHALHVTRPGRPFHQVTPARSPQNGQLSRGIRVGAGVAPSDAIRASSCLPNDIAVQRRTREGDRKATDAAISHALKGDNIGLEAIDDGLWNILYYNTLLGRLSERTGKISGASFRSDEC